MNWAFELLGLRPDAGVTDVKRAYARLLRTTRPDENPEAFQQLHAAYKTALAQVNAKAAAPTSTSMVLAQTESPSTPPPQPLSSQQPAAIDAENVPAPVIHFGVLANEVIHAAVESENGNLLSRWLQGRSEFWSIQIKQQAAHVVLQHLFQQPRAISADCMDALLCFFDLDHVLSDVNPVALQALRKRQMTLWELLPANHHALAKRIGKQYGSYPEVSSLRKDIAFLQGPFGWHRVLMAAFQIGRTNEIGHLVQALLGHGRFDELPPSIDRDHAFFWFRATSRGPMTRQRFTIRSLQMGLAASVCALVVSIVCLLQQYAPVNSSTRGRVDIPTTIEAFAITWIVVFSLWLMFAGAVWFDQWQALPESAPSRRPWLRRLAIPALCTIGLAVYEIGHVLYASWFTTLCFVFALRRFRRRSAGSDGFFSRITASMPAVIWISVWAIAALSRLQSMENFPLIPALALLTFAISIADLWRHRAFLHPKLART